MSNLSEEEKEAIEKIEKIVKKYNKIAENTLYFDFFIFYDDVEAMRIILNLIEKRQKEIERLSFLKKEKGKKYVDLCFECGKLKADLDIAEKVIDKLIEEKAIEVMCYDTKEDRKEYEKKLKEKLFKEIENE